MKNNRLKLSLAILIAILYMLCALLWWTIALIKAQNIEFKKDNQILVLQEKLEMEKIKNFIFSNNLHRNPSKTTIYIDKLAFKIDTIRLNKFAEQNISIYYLKYVSTRQQNTFRLRLLQKHDNLKQLKERLHTKTTAWILEGVTLGLITIVIGLIMFVYLDRVIRLNNQQNNFLLAVTHELKTPIAAVKLAIQTAKKKPDIDLIGKMLSMAQSNVQRLSEMVDQILLATRFETKHLVPQKIWTNLQGFIKSSIQTLELNTELEKKIRIDIPSNINFKLDEKMFYTLISNLISNSIKYSDDTFSLNISCKIEEDLLKITFEDTGIGIPNEEKKKVLQKFYRVGDEKTRTTNGSGLGLFLVDRIAFIHGGEIAITDNSPKGTRIILTFSENDFKIE